MRVYKLGEKVVLYSGEIVKLHKYAEDGSFIDLLGFRVTVDNIKGIVQKCQSCGDRCDELSDYGLCEGCYTEQAEQYQSALDELETQRSLSASILNEVR